MNEAELDDALTLDDPSAENRKPRHIWQRPNHDSIDAMTPRQQAALSREVELEIAFDQRYEEALLAENVPVHIVPTVMSAIGRVRYKERTEASAAAIRELLWQMDEAPDAANRRVLLGDSGETLREAATNDGISKSTLHRKEKAFRKKWDSRTP